MEIANLIIDEKAMRLTAFFKVFILVLALFAPSMITLKTPPVKGQPPEPQRGPRAPGLELIFYPTVGAEYAALVAGEVELMTQTLYPAQYEDAMTREEIMIVSTSEFTVINEAMMSDYYMPSYPDWRNPLNDVNFRKAVLHLADKDYYIETIYEGLAERIDVPIAAPSIGWMNTSLIGPSYPYPYSPALAIEHLEDAVAYGSAENGWYDYDNDTIRNYPLDWDGLEGTIGVRDEPNVDPLEYWILDDPPERYECAHALAEELRAIGIPVKEHPAPLSLIADQCWCAYDYHLATDGWSVGRFPTYLWMWFHSSNWRPGYCGSNCYTGGADEPWAAEVDAAVEAVIYAKTVDEAKQACFHAQSLIMDKYALWIPVCSPKGFYAYRNLLGVVPMEGVSPWNWATEMNAYRADDPNASIRIALDTPININTFYPWPWSWPWRWGWTWSAHLIQRTCEDHISLNPTDAMEEQPSLCQDWESITWMDGSIEKSLCKFWLRHDATWIEAITGNVLAPFTTEGLEFGIWYMYQTQDAWWHADYSTIHHIRTDPTDPYYIEYYWDALSWSYYLYGWSTHMSIYSLEPGKYYKQTPIVQDGDLGTAGLQPSTAVFVEGVNVTTPGDLGLPHQTVGAPVEIVSIVSNVSGTLIPSDVTGDKDYEILKGYIHIYKNLAANEKITVTYWARGNARGTTAGNLPWNEVIMGCGKWYMTSWDITTGATYSANRHHMWTTPPLAETDWCWYWIEGSKPTDGYYQITIFDVTLATSIYGCQGRLVPDAYWDPTMDLAPSGDDLPGIIDIYDVTIVTSEYGTRFWTPPAS